jgi:hypothetical protein
VASLPHPLNQPKLICVDKETSPRRPNVAETVGFFQITCRKAS